MRTKLLVVVILLGFSSVAQAAPITIADTGPGPTQTSPSALGWALGWYGGDSDAQFLVAQFSVASAVTVTSLEGWIGVQHAGTLAVGVFSGGAEVPGSLVFVDTVTVPIGGAGWVGLTGISGLSLTPGTYWIYFSAPTVWQGGMSGYMPSPSVSPLGNEALYHPSADQWLPDDALDLGVRIRGESVPDPGSTLLLLGTALAGLAGCARRWRR